MSVWSKAFVVAVSVAVLAFLHWPTLHYPVFFDDIYYFKHNGLNNIFQAGFVFEPRWLPYFATAWIDLIFDDNVFAQRLVNVGLHALTALMLYALVRQISQHVDNSSRGERAALAAALLFLLHPLTVYAVGYLVQRTILMATLFGLLALGSYFDGLVKRRKAYFLFSALFYFLSAFSKEHAILIPLAALALTPLAAPVKRESLRRLVLPVALYAAIGALVIVRHRAMIGNVYEPFAEQLIDVGGLAASAGELWFLSVMTQATLYFKYLLLTVIPNPAWMSIDLRPPFAEHIGQIKYWIGLFALSAYGVAALLLLHKGGRRGLAGYALLAPLLLFMVEFSVVRIQEPFVLYRAYLWLPLFFLLIPVLTNAMSDKVFCVMIMVIAATFAAVSIDRLNSFSSNYALWDDAVRKLPESPGPGAARAYNNRCQQNLRRGELKMAIADCNQAIRVNPKYRLSYQNRAFVLMKSGEFDEAIKDAQTVFQMHPNDPHAYTLLGVMYHSAGRIEEAKASFETGCVRGSLAACVESKNLEGKGGRGALYR